MQRAAPLTVFYDRDCNFCIVWVALVVRLDRSERIRVLPIQSEEGERRLAHVPRERRLASWHAVGRDDEHWAGGRAFAPILVRLPYGRVPSAVAARLGPVGDAGYRIVAANRVTLSRFVPSRAKRWAHGVVAAREARQAAAPAPAAPTPERIADAARRSPLRRRDGMSELADRDELAFRETHERYDDPVADVVRFIEAKELVAKLDVALAEAGVEPHGTVVELGAGTCWLAGALAKRPSVDRVIAVEFSERRLSELAPIALAHLGAPAEKVQRLVADFYDHGLAPGSADVVVTDAAYHHAADPVRLAGIAHDLLRPGGLLLLLREPSLSLLRRSRDHGVEGEHGGFEREYQPREYLRQLRDAGFQARRAPAAGNLSTPRGRALLRPPLRWLNGVVFSEFTYVARKPSTGATSGPARR